MSERFFLVIPSGDVPLDASFRPQVLAPTAATPNLVRARNYTRIFDLSDGLPDPVPRVLTGTMQAPTETELSQALASLRGTIQICTAVRRDTRPAVAISGASMVAAPIDDDSTQASVTITLIPTHLPTVQGGFDW